MPTLSLSCPLSLSLSTPTPSPVPLAGRIPAARPRPPPADGSPDLCGLAPHPPGSAPRRGCCLHRKEFSSPPHRRRPRRSAAATRHGSPFAGRSRRRGPGRGMHRTPSYTVIQVQNELKQNRASDGHVIAAPEKEALAAGCRKELAGLWAYFKEVSGHKMQIDGGGNLSSNAMIGCLLEESNLGLSKLVDETFQKLKGTEGVSVASVRSSVLLIGQRMMYGQSSPDADVLEDESDLSLWCSEVRDLKVLPMRTRGFLSVRRTARKKIHERITALHSTLSALETTGAEGQVNELRKVL
ncbi:chromatin assembly factor 1 subunit FSM-like isoform X2 [Hordeum vulgare subsp. vulgare]|uniref:chromatin assembly factor 1 subunit FSM-like isoform X2 n=1 Tax=Hordeum vulgare subsp. vulgare TaxID=112509 RepID=UPI001D1A3A2B|nr:chromatin assembly factor 1 subunit FSM-like isoform X2 [Hordeum vulgare subsp. vulgare]